MATNDPRLEPPSKKRKKGFPTLDLNGPDYLNSFYLYVEMDKWSDHCFHKILQLSKETDSLGLEVCRALHRTVLYYKAMERDIAEAHAHARREAAQRDRLEAAAAQSTSQSAIAHEAPQSTHSVSRRHREVREESGDTTVNETVGRAVEGGQGSSQTIAERERQTPLTVPRADGADPSLAGKSTVVQPVESGLSGKESSDQTEKEKERMQRESSLMVVRRVVPRNPAIPPIRQCKVEMRVEAEEERRESATTTESIAESISHHEQRVIPDDETTREVPTIRVKQEAVDENPFAVPALPPVDPPSAPSAFLRETTPPRLIIKTEPQTPPPGPSDPTRSAPSSTEKKKKKKKKKKTTEAGEATAAPAAPIIPPPPPAFAFDATATAASSTSTSYSFNPTPAAAPFISNSPSFSFTSSAAAAAAASFSSSSHSVSYNTAAAFIAHSTPPFSSTAAAAEQPSFGASHAGAELATQELLAELSTQILHVNSIKQEAMNKGLQLGHLAIPLQLIVDGSRITMDIFNCECRRVAEEVRSLDMKFDSLCFPPEDYLRVSSHTVRREIDRIWKGGRGEGSQEQAMRMPTDGQNPMPGQGMANPPINPIEKIFKMFNVDPEPAAKTAEKRALPDSILPAERSVPQKKRRLNERREGEGRESDEDEPSTSRGARHKEMRGSERRGGGKPTWCAFCKSMGDHPAFDCTIYGTNAQRQQRLKELRLCYHCLDEYRPPSCMRKEHMRKCTHCYSHSSHPAMCKFIHLPPFQQLPPGRRGPQIPRSPPYKPYKPYKSRKPRRD